MENKNKKLGSSSSKGLEVSRYIFEDDSLEKKILTSLKNGQLLSTRQLKKETDHTTRDIQSQLKELLKKGLIKKTYSLQDARVFLYYLNNSKKITTGQG